jgi:PD-(D/E)XK nuclease superfamily
MMGNKRKLGELLIAHDFAGMQTLFTAFFASIPAPGLDLTLEDAYRHGRLGMAVGFNQQIYLFEFKVVELTPEGKALQQIKDKGYADKYRAEGHPIHLIGVEFSREQRSVVGIEVESL